MSSPWIKRLDVDISTGITMLSVQETGTHGVRQQAGKNNTNWAVSSPAKGPSSISCWMQASAWVEEVVHVSRMWFLAHLCMFRNVTDEPEYHC